MQTVVGGENMHINLLVNFTSDSVTSGNYTADTKAPPVGGSVQDRQDIE